MTKDARELREIIDKAEYFERRDERTLEVGGDHLEVIYELIVRLARVMLNDTLSRGVKE